jgi:hypothetical protein
LDTHLQQGILLFPTDVHMDMEHSLWTCMWIQSLDTGHSFVSDRYAVVMHMEQMKIEQSLDTRHMTYDTGRSFVSVR